MLCGVDLKKDEVLSELLKAASKSGNPSAKSLLKVIQDGVQLQDQR